MVIKRGRFQNSDQQVEKLKKAISPQELLTLLQSRDQEMEIRTSNTRVSKGRFYIPMCYLMVLAEYRLEVGDRR